MKRKKRLGFSEQGERRHSLAHSEVAAEKSHSLSGADTMETAESASLNEAVCRLRSVHEQLQDVASQIPPFSPERIHALVESDRLSQFQLRRQADRYLLALCLCLLTLAASILWHTASAGFSPLNVAVLTLSFAVILVVLRAARSLWLMRQIVRLRPHPYRMAHYADRLRRLSRRRRLWLRFVLRGSYGSSSDSDYSHSEFFSLRLPSYSIAACLLLLIALNADKTFSTTHYFAKVTTTSDKTDRAICDTVKILIAQL